jgi:hypothetical protein
VASRACGRCGPVRCKVSTGRTTLLAPGQQSLHDSGRRESALALFPGALGERLALLQVGVDFGLVPEVMGDDGVHVDQRNRWVLLRDFLGRRTGLNASTMASSVTPVRATRTTLRASVWMGHPIEDICRSC